MAEEEQAQIFNIKKIYVRDSSFEAPGAPGAFPQTDGKPWQPQQQLGMELSHRKIADNLYEMVVKITVTVQNGEETAFIVEVHQAGLFEVLGFPEDQLEYVLVVGASQQLFPYIRQAMSSLTVDGGFPAFLLAPIDFQQVYENQKQNSAEAATAAES